MLFLVLRTPHIDGDGGRLHIKVELDDNIFTDNIFANTTSPLLALDIFNGFLSISFARRFGLQHLRIRCACFQQRHICKPSN